jgi:DNA polymerase III epsilon subunit-like protein
MSTTRYCSLDIETSGFDPVKDEILELGFVFFELSAKGIKVTKEYTKVFKPKGQVSETILGLTGITKIELENAEDFSKFKEEIQQELKDACIVGHNIIFDVRFLEGNGIKFSGQFIDTLDLVQFILPTHHSYNLENLMHYFGLKHTEAHRALADAKAVLKVLEDLLIVYSNFPQALRDEVTKLLETYDFAWKEFLSTHIKGRLKLVAHNSKKLPINKGQAALQLEPNSIYNFPLGYDFLEETIWALKAKDEKAILVLPQTKQVLEAWQTYELDPIFVSTQLFDAKAFLAFRQKPQLTSDELKFILKVLVWQNTNWQVQIISDLNLSFFGGQFRQFICGEKEKENKRSKILVCDLASYFYFTNKGWYKDRKAVFVGLTDFEKALSENISEKVSWGYINFLLKSIYNPETRAGNSKVKVEVEAGLIAVDLFFGLVNALLQSDPPGFFKKKFDEQALGSEKINKITAAGESCANKLWELNKTLNSVDLELFINKLRKFFEPLDNRVKWVELSNTSVALFSSPINIVELAHANLKPNKAVVFCDCLPIEKVLPYFSKRLGLEKFKQVHIKTQANQDLFHALGRKTKKLEIQATNITEAEVLQYCGKKNLPAAILLGNSLQVKEIYFKNHETLQKEAFVLAQTSSSGSRILRNFSIHKESLLMATDKFVLKSINTQGSGSPLSSLPVKTLVLAHIPFDQYKHPYFEALANEFENAFEEFSLPKALLNFHQVIRFFYTPNLKQVVVYDAKLEKSYSKIFWRYLEETFA